MPSAIGGKGDHEPSGLWDAMGILARIQHEQRFAIQQGDMERLDRLLTEQITAWTHVHRLAAYLIERKKAPADLIERLRQVLHVHEQREAELLAATIQARDALEHAIAAAAHPPLVAAQAA